MLLCKQMSANMSIDMFAFMAMHASTCQQAWPVYMPVDMSMHMSMHMSPHTSAHISANRPMHMPTCMSIHMSIHMSVHMSIHMSLHMRCLCTGRRSFDSYFESTCQRIHARTQWDGMTQCGTARHSHRIATS